MVMKVEADDPRIDIAHDLYAKGRSIQEIARELGVCERSAYAVLNARPEDYEAVKHVRADVLVGEMMEIADDSDPVMAACSRVRVDTRKWLASRLSRQYSDKQELTVQGTIGIQPVIQVSLSKPKVQAIDVIDVIDSDAQLIEKKE